jgi:hypothetical protein
VIGRGQRLPFAASSCGLRLMFMDEHVSTEALLRQVEELRGQARRARRLAETLVDGNDRARLLDHAKELDERADGLERKAAAAKDEMLKR